MIYLICYLADLLPRERSVTLEPLQLAGDINYEHLLLIHLICGLGDLLPTEGAWRQNAVDVIMNFY